MHTEAGVPALELCLKISAFQRPLVTGKHWEPEGSSRASAGSHTHLQTCLPTERGEVPLCIRQPVWASAVPGRG